MIAWVAAPALAGAWTRDTGELYTKAGAEVYRAFEFVNSGGALVQDDGSYFGQQYSVYAEAGVIPGGWAQVTVKAPFVVGTLSAEYEDALGSVPLRATTSRLGDLEVGGQVRLHPKAPLALAVIGKIPMYGNESVGEDYPTFRELFPKPGDGQVDLTGWVYAGFVPVDRSFVEVGAGYRHRTELFVGWPSTTLTYVDGVVFLAKGGYRFGKVLPILGIDGLVSVADDPYSREYLSVAATALIDVAEGVAIEPRIAGEPWADKASRGIGGGVGLSYRR